MRLESGYAQHLKRPFVVLAGRRVGFCPECANF